MVLRYHSQTIQRQHGAVAQMEAGQASSQNQQWFVPQKNRYAADLLITGPVFDPACRVVINRGSGDQRDRGDR